ncbi:MAG: L-seryl-tRNA(Sec) selenium transferase [Jatrophihabitans sp.]
MDDPRRAVPRTNTVLDDPRLADAVRRFGRDFVKSLVVGVLQRVRDGHVAPDCAVEEAARSLPAANGPAWVINATGVVLHTNLGRAPLSRVAAEAARAASLYTALEFDLATGRRGPRARSMLDALLRAVPDAGDALVVNNGAAALVLATTALASGREVIVSRGEMVEIGDGFRLPDLIESTGAHLHEVGTANRVTLADYRDAMSERTAAVLKVHPSNFRIEGFTSSVPAAELAGLGLPLVADVGSGLLSPHPLLPDEPDVASMLRAGASVVTCSGDKLLGGPQAGLVLGRPDTVARMRRHPLARALRVDKLTIAALEATLTGPPTPTWTSLTVSADDLRRRCDLLAEAVGGEVVASDGAVGGGCAPGVPLPGWAVALPAAYAALLRAVNPPIIGRVERDRCLLDLRCVPEQLDEVVRDLVLAL